MTMSEKNGKHAFGQPLNGIILETRIAGLLQAGEAAVLVTVMASSGSAPRHAGTRALHTRQGFLGTVGGGIMEARAMETARLCLSEGKSMRKTFALDASAPDTDMICGGQMEVLCEFLQPEQARMFALAGETLKQGKSGFWQVKLSGGEKALPKRRLVLEACADADLEGLKQLAASLKNKPGLVSTAEGELYLEPLDAPPVLFLFGGGHVSLEVARLAQACGFVVDVVDDRPEFSNPSRFPMARHCHVRPGFTGLAALGLEPRHYAAIMTRGHAFDREVLEQVLAIRPQYLGMIGSRTKREQIYNLLKKQGISEEELAAVHCPIGLAIKAETPAQIAVSIVSELLAARAGTLAGLRAGYAGR